MKPKFLLSFATSVLFASALTVTAATFTWDGGSLVDANSATVENWVDDLALTSNPDIIFGPAGISGTAITWSSGNVSSMTFASDASAYGLSNASGFQFIKVGVDSIANNSLNTQNFSSNLRVFFNGTKAFNANTADLSLSSVTFRADSMTAGQINTLVLTGAKDGTISGVINTAGTFTNLATGLRNAVTKTGTGTWILEGANTYGGLTTVQNGTLTLSGNRTTAMASGITLGGGGAVSQTLNLQNGNFSLGGSFTIGNGGSTAIVNHTGGTISGVAGSGILLGNGNGTSTYNLSAGALTGNMIMGVNTATVGTNVNNFNLSGTGSFTSGNLQVGRTGSANNVNTDNTFTQTGGTATITTLGLGGNSGDSASTSPIAAKLDLTAGVFTATNFSSLSAGGANTSVINIGGTADVTLGAFPIARGDLSTATLTFDGGTLKPAAASAVYMAGLTNAFLTANGAKIDVASGRDITISQTLENAASNEGTLTKLGVGKLTLSGTNSHTGKTTLSAGTLSVATIGDGGAGGNLGAATDAAANLEFDGGTLQYTGATASTNRNFTINALKTATIEVASDTLTMTGTAPTTTGFLYKTGAGSLILDPGAGGYLVGALTANGGNLELQSGTFATTGADPFNAAYNVGAGARGGKLVIDGATLNVGGGKALKVGAAANGNLEIKSGTVTANDLVLGHNGSSVGTQSGGSVTVTNLFHQDGGTGNSYTLTGGSLTAARIYNNTASANDFTLNLDGGTLYSAAGTTHLIDEAGRGGAEITVLLGTGNTVIDTTSSSATIVGGMGNMPSVAGTFTKDGANTLTLAGNSSYTGATTVSAGTLLVSGSLGDTAVTVGENGILGGTGSIAGNVHFGSMATLQIIDLFDSLTIGGGVTFGSGFGFSNLLGFDVETVGSGTYTLLDGSIDLTGVQNVGIGNAYQRGDGKLAYFQSGSLQVVVIPEPSAALLGGLGFLALLRRRVRSTR